MKIAVTGAGGFLGWHFACRLAATQLTEPLLLSRPDLVDADCLAAVLADADALVHLAGVNRAPDERSVEQGNAQLGALVANAVRKAGRPLGVVFANSIQADHDNPYGRGKAEASRLVGDAVRTVGGQYADVRLPNLFGERGRPAYNSFVATFAHEVAHGRTPAVVDDREIPLMHAQDAAAFLLARVGEEGVYRPAGEMRSVSAVLDKLQQMDHLYRRRGDIPPLSSAFDVSLFNTYRAVLFPDMWPLSPVVHSDDRGRLFEGVRVHGGTGQTFVSTTRPGQVRGNHYHLRKVERFLVVEGEAEIALRRLFSDDVVRFRLSGNEPAFVDMPTMWTHSVRNVGSSQLVTVFWADQLLDPHQPDQFPLSVEPEHSGGRA